MYVMMPDADPYTSSRPTLSAEESFWYQPIESWVAELQTRFQEAQQANTNTVDLSHTHPRGYFPNQILRRRPIRDILKTAVEQGWLYLVGRSDSTSCPSLYFLPLGWPATALTDGSLAWCDLKPFEDEISYRLETDRTPSGLRVADLTAYHPRGAIHPTLMTRLERRKDPKWRWSVRQEIDKLFGQANKDEAFAETQRGRAEAVASRHEGTGDPTALLAAAEELVLRAAQLREQARMLKKELGES